MSKGSVSPVPLSGGYTARVDVFPNGHGTDFEIHIYDKSGKEVGVLGSKGWIPKHGHSGAVPDIPQTVLDSAKGVWSKEARRHGMLPKKGFGSIKSEALDRIFKRAKGLSKICPPLIILDGVLGAGDTKKILEGDQGALCDWFPGYCDPGWL